MMTALDSLFLVVMIFGTAFVFACGLFALAALTRAPMGEVGEDDN